MKTHSCKMPAVIVVQKYPKSPMLSGKGKRVQYPSLIREACPQKSGHGLLASIMLYSSQADLAQKGTHCRMQVAC